MNSLFGPQQPEAIATTPALSPPQLGPGLQEKTTTSQQEFPDCRMPSFFKMCTEQGGGAQLPTRSHGWHPTRPLRRPRPKAAAPLACTYEGPEHSQTTTKKMWNNRLPSAFASQLAEEALAGGAGSALFTQAAETWRAPPSSPDQVLESSGAGRWPANCHRELQHHRANSETKNKLRLAAAEAEKWAASKKERKKNGGGGCRGSRKGQMQKEVWLITRHCSPMAWVGVGPKPP